MKDEDKKYDTARDYGSDKVQPIFPPQAPTPNWLPFRGFSFLFDNPGGEYTKENNCLKLAPDVHGNPDLSIYKQIAIALERIGAEELTRQWLFFPLPYSTYHVTVWDGVNTGIISRMSKESQIEFNKCFINTESIIKNWPPLIREPEICSYFSEIKPLRFKYKHLRSRGETVLVVELEPADSESAAELGKIYKIREELDNYFEKYSKPRNYEYLPHVAVGYFADTELSKSAVSRFMDTWIEVFDNEVSGQVIEFRSISLYAFIDMITYLKQS